MTIRNLDAVLKPASIAVVGATARPGAVAEVLTRNLLSGGFRGPIHLVSAGESEIAGRPVLADIDRLPAAPDLAVIAAPAREVPGLVARLAARGTRGVIVIGAGFGPGAPDGPALRRALLDAARPGLTRILGPNSLGALSPLIGLNASFAPVPALRGDLAFVSQSGAVLAGVLDWAAPRQIGFSHLISLGDMLDADLGDTIDWLARAPHVRAILLYIEAVTAARKFMSAARAAARSKPLIAIKAGRHDEAALAAASHTGALAGSDAVFEAAFRRAGGLRVRTLDELFDAVATLAAPPRIRGEELAILTNGGGFGVLATDALIDRGGRLATLRPATIAALDRVLPCGWSRGNPVDILGDAPGSRYAEALEILLEDPEAGAVVVLNGPSAVASSLDAAQAVVATLGQERQPVIAGWIGEISAEPARRLFTERGVPCFDTPNRAVRGFTHLVRAQRARRMLMETPPALPGGVAADLPRARAPIAAALAEGRDALTGPEAMAVLAAFGIPTARTVAAADPAEAAARAAELDAPVALKIQSPDIPHKSDVGGVVLDLEGPEAVRAAAAAMLRRVRRARPQARIDGFTVQAMLHRPGAQELILGLATDAQFGPVVLFGEGGTKVEVVADRALALPPLNLLLARELMGRTRIWRLLQGYSDHPAADLDAIAMALIRLSALACDLPEVVELDINPLIADAAGVVALDAAIRIAPRPPGPATRRLAILPYPRELEREETLPDGTTALLRPVRPEDEPAFVAAMERMAPEDIRMRFFGPIPELSHDIAARLTQLDYDREMALVLERRDAAGDPENLGVVRFSADPDNQRAEFAIIVRSDLKGRGIGRLLMRRILDHARNRGIAVIFGDILQENTAMIDLARHLGFVVEPIAESPAIVRATLRLQEGRATAAPVAFAPARP